MNWQPENLPYETNLDTIPILKKLATAHRSLAELKGIAQSIPKQEILINTLALQEAKDSSKDEKHCADFEIWKYEIIGGDY